MQSDLRFDDAKIYLEEKSNEQSQINYKAYIRDIENDNKAIMMCTARGKLSEGLNFSDNLARACFVLGIPYHLINETSLSIKKYSLD